MVDLIINPEVGAFLACVVVFMLSKMLIAKPHGIGIHEEYKANVANKTKNYLNLIMGCMFCAISAYVVTGKLLFVIISIPGGWFIASWLQKRKEIRRQQLLKDQYIQVLGALITSMQGGASPYQAFEEIVPGLPYPAKDIFIEIVRRSRTGSTHLEALNSVAAESGWKDLETLQMALSLYNTTGSNLVEILKNHLNNTYETTSDQKYVEATTSAIRATCSMLSFLPFILMAVSRMMAPEFTAPLYNTTGGIIILILVVIMVFLGNTVTRKMLNKAMGI